ncbi:MAG: M20/M25/M40 family metallo-hydrolase [Reyranellaceae bacterium]
MAEPPLDSLLRLASRLVATPSCAGIDPPDAVLALIGRWFAEAGLECRLLTDAEGKPVATMVEIVGRASGPLLCLDACIDTAPAGDPATWSTSPFSGEISGNRLRGRGAADSKAGVAILAHVARDLAAEGLPRGTLHVLFDADEHTGRFGGARAYLAAVARRPDGATLGYPGNELIVAGGRGFLRSRVHFGGRAAHSGAIGDRGVNAIGRAAAFVLAVEQQGFSVAHDAAFPFGPAATVTRIAGGEGFSVVPDRATCEVDMRLTRSFDGAQARDWLGGIAREADPGCRIEEIDHWPAYVTEVQSPLVAAFATAAQRAFGRALPAEVSPLSNIGNLLAAEGVPTICAPGVGHANIHAADESAEVDTFLPVYRMYREAALKFLSENP